MCAINCEDCEDNDTCELRPTAFIVHSKDLFNIEKNPNLSLSPKDIWANPKIPKKKTGIPQGR